MDSKAAQNMERRARAWLRARPELMRRIPLLSLIAGLILLTISGAALFYLNNYEEKAFRWVNHTLEVQESARQYHTLVQNAVIGQRGYLLTGEDRFLEPYRSALAAIPAAQAEIRELVRSDSVQQTRLDEMDRLVERLLSDLPKPVEIALGGERIQALRLVQKDSVDEVLQDFRLEVDRFLKEEDRLLRDRKEKKLHAEQFVFVVSFVTICLVTGLIISAFFVVRNQERVFRVAERTFRNTNLELERRVAERTAQLETEKARTEAENKRAESLLRDLNHRVGNNLQLVASFLGLQMNQVNSKEAQYALKTARERILSIASAQRRLRLSGQGESVEAAGFLGAIIEDLEANFDAEQDVTIECSAEGAFIPSKDAVSIGVIATELITNALKYAFDGLPGGTIRVTLNARNNDESFELEVADDGVGLNSNNANSKGGLGTRIIERLTVALGGEVERTEASSGSKRPGTVVRVIFPNPNLI